MLLSRRHHAGLHHWLHGWLHDWLHDWLNDWLHDWLLNDNGRRWHSDHGLSNHHTGSHPGADHHVVLGSGARLSDAKRARAALPLLVRQAEAGAPVFYSDLAEELGMSNPRNLNYVLGSIGQSLKLLSKAWKSKVPPIQCLVVNKNTGLPGEGIGWFLVKKEDFSRLPLRQKRSIVEAELQHVFSYPHWQEVLEALELEPIASDLTPFVSKAAGGFGGGESEDHKALKAYVAQNPSVIGLGVNTPTGETEFPLPSGDSLDVSFNGKKVWIAAEVKSSISDRKSTRLNSSHSSVSRMPSSA